MPPRFDPNLFLRPIAHRGLHNPAAGVIENTGSAFQAALHKGYGIECDIRPTQDRVPVVFHDRTLSRLMDDPRLLQRVTYVEVQHLRHTIGGEPILAFSELLALVEAYRQNGGLNPGPILAEIKSEAGFMDLTFLEAVAACARAYRGPLALMSFDVDAVRTLADLVPDIPRGLVVEPGQEERPGRIPGGGDLSDLLEEKRRWPDSSLGVMSHAEAHSLLLMNFLACHAVSLPTSLSRYAQGHLAMPIFAWTVRSAAEWERVTLWADAPIFEGYEP